MIKLPMVSPKGTNYVLSLIEEDVGIVPGMIGNQHRKDATQAEITRALDNECQSFLDIGANLGCHLIPALVDFPDRHIEGIDGSGYNILHLEESLKENGLTCKVHEALLGDGSQVNFNYSPHYCGQAHVIGFPTGISQSIKSTRLAELLGDKRFDLIKIDIEGSELITINDSPEVFAAAKEIIIELNNEVAERYFGYNCVRVYDRLVDLGFTKCQLLTHDGFPIDTDNPRQYIENVTTPHIDAVFTK